MSTETKRRRSTAATTGTDPAVHLPDTLPNTIGKYQVESRLGTGAMGVVYKCTQPDLERPVAVKVLVAARHADESYRRRFQREAWAAAQLDHANVVKVYDIGAEGELPFFVMEYIDGCSLDRLIGTPILNLETTLRLVYQVARGLQTAHEHKIIHRDIKPSNILITRSGQAKLADFGLAKSLHDDRSLSDSGDIIGTPRYMSPEQVLSAPKDLDARTDVYSLGAVMYEMLCGVPPVDGPNALAILRRLTDEEPIPLRERNPAFPEEVVAICERAMAKDVTARTPTAQRLAEEIQAFLLEKMLRGPIPLAFPALAGLDGPTTKLMAPKRPRPAWRKPLALAGVVALLVLAGLLGWYLRDPLPAQRRQILQRAQELREYPAAGMTEAAARERLQTLVSELDTFLARAPADAEVRLVRARLLRQAGECSSAISDASELLRHAPDHVAARRERLFAGYQLHVLYLGNLPEPLLRPRRLDLVRTDMQAIREKRPDTSALQEVELIQALARQDFGEAGRIAESWVPGPEDGDDWMLVIDALLRAADKAHGDVAIAPDNAAKEQLRRRWQALSAQADGSLRRALAANPTHAGLLFLAANSYLLRAGWEANEQQDRAALLRKQRGNFEAACDRLRHAALGRGGDPDLAGAVLLDFAGQDEAALERVKVALTRRSCPAFAYTFQAWLHVGAYSDTSLSPEEAERLLTDLAPGFRTDPEESSPYFVRALLRAASGHWREAREDLRTCRRRLGTDDLGANTAVHNDWLVRANASTTEYLDATLGVLVQLPVPPESRSRLAEELLKHLTDPGVLKRDGVSAERARDLAGGAHFQLARALARDPKHRADVLQHVRDALKLRAPNVTAALFQGDQALQVWNEDKEFKELYAKFPPPKE
jgi:predicted Ser/Thr protein kinase